MIISIVVIATTLALIRWGYGPVTVITVTTAIGAAAAEVARRILGRPPRIV